MWRAGIGNGASNHNHACSNGGGNFFSPSGGTSGSRERRPGDVGRRNQNRGRDGDDRPLPDPKRRRRSLSPPFPSTRSRPPLTPQGPSLPPLAPRRPSPPAPLAHGLRGSHRHGHTPHAFPLYPLHPAAAPAPTRHYREHYRDPYAEHRLSSNRRDHPDRCDGSWEEPISSPAYNGCRSRSVNFAAPGVPPSAPRPIPFRHRSPSRLRSMQEKRKEKRTARADPIPIDDREPHDNDKQHIGLVDSGTNGKTRPPTAVDAAPRSAVALSPTALNQRVTTENARELLKASFDRLGRPQPELTVKKVERGERTLWEAKCDVPLCWPQQRQAASGIGWGVTQKEAEMSLAADVADKLIRAGVNLFSESPDATIVRSGGEESEFNKQPQTRVLSPPTAKIVPRSGSPPNRKRNVSPVAFRPDVTSSESHPMTVQLVGLTTPGKLGRENSATDSVQEHLSRGSRLQPHGNGEVQGGGRLLHTDALRDSEQLPTEKVDDGRAAKLSLAQRDERRITLHPSDAPSKLEPLSTQATLNHPSTSGRAVSTPAGIIRSISLKDQSGKPRSPFSSSHRSSNCGSSEEGSVKKKPKSEVYRCCSTWDVVPVFDVFDLRKDSNKEQAVECLVQATELDISVRAEGPTRFSAEINACHEFLAEVTKWEDLEIRDGGEGAPRSRDRKERRASKKQFDLQRRLPLNPETAWAFVEFYCARFKYDPPELRVSAGTSRSDGPAYFTVEMYIRGQLAAVGEDVDENEARNHAAVEAGVEARTRFPALWDTFSRGQ